MFIDSKEIEEIIDSITEDIVNCDFNYEEYANPLIYCYDGNVQVITFLDYYIWDDDTDPREYDDEKNEYEPLEPFLRKEITKILTEIGKIEVYG